MNNSGRFRRASTRVNILLSLAVVVFSIASCSAQSPLMSLKPANATSPPVATSGVAGVQTSYADLVTRVAPAVVTIRSTERVRTAQQFPFMDDPTFRQFFGDRMPQQQQTPQRV